MSRARVDDIEALKMFRAQLFKFAEAAGVALGDSESEIHRTIGWLDNEQQQHWVSQHRKRLGLLAQAKEALRMKKIFTGPAGSRQSCVDEEKAVQKALKAVAEAEQKIAAVKQWSRRLQKELLMYKGQTQRFATSTTVDIPLAAAVLGNMIVRLESYASLAPSDARSAVGATESTAAGGGAGGMARPDGGDAAAIAAAFAALRGSTPSVPNRAGAPVESINLTPIKLQTISESDVQTLAGLPAFQPVDPLATVVVSVGIADKQRLYLERVGPSKPGDTGWFIGPAEIAANPFVVTVPVSELLGARPEWAALLALPAGSLVIIDAGAVGAVLDAGNQDLWAEASMKKLLSAADAAAGDNAAGTGSAPAAPQSPPQAQPQQPIAAATTA
jgi:hypothetical protein